ncbi:MAG: hypothetical protein WAM77_12465, partial [Xanthobacteraceae bacterium]
LDTELLAFDDRRFVTSKNSPPSSADEPQVSSLTEMSPVARRRMDHTYSSHGFNAFHEPHVTKTAAPTRFCSLCASFVTDQLHEFANRFGEPPTVIKMSCTPHKKP